MSSVHSPGATSARQTKTKTTQGKNLSSMTSVFFLTTSQRKIAPPPKQTVVQVACCFWIEREIIFTLALHSVRYSPHPPPQKKKIIFLQMRSWRNWWDVIFSCHQRRKEKSKEKTNELRCLMRPVPISGSSPSGAGGWSANNCCKEVSAYFWNSHQVSRISIMRTTVRGKSRSFYFNCEIIILKEQHLPQ